ncbi:MAG TPA: GNAT family N-acetyltransferase [Candidatus Dormibacteraeota bacterium]
MAARLALLRREGATSDGRRYLIRPAAREDAPAMVALRDAVAAEGDLIAAAPGERSVVEEELSLSTLLSQGGLPLTLLVDGDVAGQLLVSRRSERFLSHIGEIAIIVSNQCRGQGLGRQMMEAAIDWARAVGITKLSLSVFTSNERAIALYRAMGFEEEGVRRRQVLLADGPRDVLLMALHL